MIKFFRNIPQTENLALTLKGKFSNYKFSQMSMDTPLGVGGARGQTNYL